jgi:hypothetical protein
MVGQDVTGSAELAMVAATSTMLQRKKAPWTSSSGLRKRKRAIPIMKSHSSQHPAQWCKLPLA